MPSANIALAKWVGLRCRVQIEGQAAGCLVDLRDRANDPATSLTHARPVANDGTAALVVTDDGREGSAAILVLVDETGTILDKMAVTVGE